MILLIPCPVAKAACSARGGSIALSYRNCVITPGWRLMRTWYRTCFHTLYDENIYIYIYIYIYILTERFKTKR